MLVNWLYLQGKKSKLFISFYWKAVLWFGERQLWLKLGCKGSPQWLSIKEGTCNAGHTGDVGSIPGSGRSPGGGQDNPLSIPAWKIPWKEEADGLQSIGSYRIRQDWSKGKYVKLPWGLAGRVTTLGDYISKTWFPGSWETWF